MVAPKCLKPRAPGAVLRRRRARTAGALVRAAVAPLRPRRARRHGARGAILLDTLDTVRDARCADLFVAFEPAEAASEIQSLVGKVTGAFPQRGETVGERMRHGFATLFARGYSNVVMIGSGLATLPPAHVRQAFVRLHERDGILVIGPAVDGGYYLLGRRGVYSQLFAAIPWSAPDVLASTARVAETLGLTVSRVPAWYNVDGLDDLQGVMRDEQAAKRTRAWVHAHGEIDQLLHRR